MAFYRTEQQTCLVKFLKAHSREPMTVHEMYRRMKQEYASMTIPGESTIYRLIRKLTYDGLVRKSLHTGQREIFYSYANPTDQNAGLYMRCKVCGQLQPMQTECSEQIVKQIREQENFAVDACMILEGVCQDCQ